MNQAVTQRLSLTSTLLLLLAFTSRLFAYDLTVAKDGTGNYTTVQAANDGLSQCHLEALRGRQDGERKGAGRHLLTATAVTGHRHDRRLGNAKANLPTTATP